MRTRLTSGRSRPPSAPARSRFSRRLPSRLFEAYGRTPCSYLPVGPSAPPHRAGIADRARAFAMSARRFATRADYATLAEAPVPLLKTHNWKKVAMIGARGYTGQALISLFSAHPTLDLTRVSLRQLAGFLLDEYTKVPITYGNLSPTGGRERGRRAGARTAQRCRCVVRRSAR
jgi:hypothetical protein